MRAHAFLWWGGQRAREHKIRRDVAGGILDPSVGSKHQIIFSSKSHEPQLGSPWHLLHPETPWGGKHPNSSIIVGTLLSALTAG